MRSRTKAFAYFALLASAVAVKAQETKPVVFPLHLEIKANAVVKDRELGAGDDGAAVLQDIVVKVKIRKTSSSPYTEPLNAELYVVGRRVRNDVVYGILDIVKKKGFTLTPEDNYVYEFESDHYVIGHTTGKIEVGGEYEAYVVIVTDKDGKIVGTKSSRKLTSKEIDALRKFRKGIVFDKDGNIVGNMEQAKENFKAAVPVALQDDDDD